MLHGLSAKNWHQSINKLIEAGRLNDALDGIQTLVDRIFCEPISVAKVFSSPILDGFCQEIGQVNLKRQTERDLAIQTGAKRKESSPPTIFIVSRLQPSGGHTAALADILRSTGASRSIVLATGTCGSPNLNEAKSRFSDIAGLEFEQAPPGNHLLKLNWLQHRLAQLQPAAVWLLNHHQDSVAVAAVQPRQAYKVHFYHHGDHHLCLGVHLDFAEHYDPHSMGFHNCREAIGIQNNHYLPLVVADQGERPTNLGFLQNGRLVTCTAAGSNKVEVPYFTKYTDVIPEVLHLTGGKHLHIGRLTSLARWKIRRGMRRLGVPIESFIYIPYVPSVWRALHEFQVDLYLASFPYGGGRTLIEVMGAGVPAVIHKHCSSRMLGGFDMAYAEATSWLNKTELFEALMRFDGAALEQQGRQARVWYERYHRPNILTEALATSGRLHAPDLRSDFHPDPFFQALQDSDEVNIQGVVYRTAWRIYRRWKARLGRMV